MSCELRMREDCTKAVRDTTTRAAIIPGMDLENPREMRTGMVGAERGTATRRQPAPTDRKREQGSWPPSYKWRNGGILPGLQTAGMSRKLEVHVPLLPCCFMVVLGQGLPEPAGVPGVWIQYRPHVQYGLEGGHVRISYFPFLGESLAGHPDSAAGNTTSLRISL